MQVYTDWANHYLEKTQRGRLIVDLQRDLQDCTFVRDVIEAVCKFALFTVL